MGITYLSRLLFENGIKVKDVAEGCPVSYPTISCYGTVKLKMREHDAIRLFNFFEKNGVECDYDKLVENQEEPYKQRIQVSVSKKRKK
jgi:hypothetical protein